MGNVWISDLQKEKHSTSKHIPDINNGNTCKFKHLDDGNQSMKTDNNEDILLDNYENMFMEAKQTISLENKITTLQNDNKDFSNNSGSL